MQFDTYAYPGQGPRPLTLKGLVWNRTGGTVAIGEVLMTDTKGTQAEDTQVAGSATNVSGTLPITNRGADGFPLNNVIVPATAGLGGLGTTAIDPGYWFGVVTGLGTDGTGADNTRVEVTYQGVVLAKMAATLATPQWGVVVTAANAVKTLTVTTAAGQKLLGRLEQDTTTANALALVFFNGIDGIGGTSGAAS